jgi:hypothetical protein
MKICFLETETSEQAFFETALAEHQVTFALELEEVESDTRILCLYIHNSVNATVSFSNRS